MDGGLDGAQEVACTNVSPLPTLINVINFVNYSPLEPFNQAALFDLSDGSLNILRGVTSALRPLRRKTSASKGVFHLFSFFFFNGEPMSIGWGDIF